MLAVLALAFIATYAALRVTVALAIGAVHRTFYREFVGPFSK